jgi:hypothetical protein
MYECHAARRMLQQAGVCVLCLSSLTWCGTGLELCSTRLEVRARVFDIANVCEATYAYIAVGWSAQHIAYM